MKNVYIYTSDTACEIRTPSGQLLHNTDTIGEAFTICAKKGYHLCYIKTAPVEPLIKLY